jgi:hypothetical protein
LDLEQDRADEAAEAAPTGERSPAGDDEPAAAALRTAGVEGSDGQAP